MFHKTWHFWLFQESKLVLVPFYSPRCHCHTVMDVSKKRPQHHPWQMKVIRSVRFGPGVLRGDCAPWLLWTTLRCCVKTNLGPTQKLQKFYGFFLDKCGRHLLMCWKNGEENTEKNKLVDKLMSYAWWFEEKKLSFVALQTFRMQSEKFKRNLCQRLLCHVQHQSQERQRCNLRGWMEI